MIRKAIKDDSKEITVLIIRSWKTAYKIIIWKRIYRNLYTIMII